MSPLPFALSGGHLGAILERFGSPRGSMFKPFSFHFAMLEAREAFQATPLQDAERAVSYTHLTLPTKRIV